MVRQASCPDMGLLPDAEPRSSHSGAGNGRGVGACNRRSPSPLHETDQLPGRLAGHLWQERFASFPMDEPYLLAAVRYVEMNPVAAGLSANPEEYRWSSAAAHLAGNDDRLVTVKPLLDMGGDRQEFLTLAEEEELAVLKKHERSGRPLGAGSFIERLEAEMARLLRPAKRGPKLNA